MTNQIIPGSLTEPHIRQAFPILNEVIYLNVGTYGLMPEPAIVEFQAMQAEFERGGQASKHTCHHKTEETRQRIAQMINGQKEEIAFTRNASDGINLVLAGIDWHPGDEVITTTEEHEAMNHPLLYLQRTKGIITRRVEVSPVGVEMQGRLDQVVSKRTRLVAMSYITCETGIRLPASAISKWAADRQLPVLFDGAQASGAFSVNVIEMGCDYYASNGHKWLGGPKGTGFFWGKRQALNNLNPTHVGAGSLEKADILTGEAQPFTTGQRFEFGTRAWSLTAGLGASMDWLEGIGWNRVYGHIKALSGYLKQSILERPYLKLLTPIDFNESSGLTSFVIEGHNAGEVATHLREKHRIFTRVIPHYNAMRIATAHFNNQQDIDRLMVGIEEVI